MAFVHRKLLSSTLNITITKLPCPPQFCFKLCSYELPPPPPPPPPPHEHHLVPTSMTIMACVMGVFFILGMICIVAGLKYLKRIVSRRRNPPLVFLTQDDFVDEDHVPVIDHPIWLIKFVGLQQSVIDSITVCKYKRGEGLIEGTECSVCLGEFEEDEDLRLLPKCSHAFHLPCIDTWLRSHKNCPLCRAPVVSSTADVASEPARIDSSEETQLEGHENGVGEDVARSEIDGTGDVGYGSATPNIVQIRRPNGLLNGKSCDSLALSGLAETGEMGLEGEFQVQSMRRSVSMDVSLASVIYDAVAHSGKEHGNPDGAEMGESKTSKLAGTSSSSNSSRNTSTSLCRLMKSASLKRPCSSRNCRTLDSMLPM